MSDAGNVKTGAPAGIHDDIVMALALATWTPGRFNPNAKVDARLLPPTPGQLPKPRRAGIRWKQSARLAHQVSALVEVGNVVLSTSVR